MFQLKESYKVHRKVLNSDNVGKTSSEICTINTGFSQKHDTVSEDSVISLLYNYLDINFDVVHARTNNRHADKKDIRLVILGPNFYLVTTT